MMRTCERFCQSPFYLDALDPQDVTRLLAYNDVRQEEENEMLEITLMARQPHQ